MGDFEYSDDSLDDDSIFDPSNLNETKVMSDETNETLCNQ